MKKLIVCFICVLLLFQNATYVEASETIFSQETNQEVLNESVEETYHEEGKIEVASMKQPSKLSTGVYIIHTALDDEKVLDIEGSTLDDGAYLQINDFVGTNVQKFEVVYNEQGYYTITNIASGKVLDIKGGNTAKGTEVWQYSANGSIAQQWEIVPVKGEYYMLVAKSCGRSMEVVGGSNNSGTGIQINDVSSTEAQLFRFEKTEELEEEPEEGDIPENKPEKIENGIYTIYTALADKKVLDIRGGALEDGAYLQIYDSNGTDAQKFQVSYNEQGYYTITNRASGKVLDIKGGNTAKGTEVWQYRENGSIAQQWEIVPVKGEYYMLVAKSCGRNMEVVGGSSASGTGIQINDMSSADAQLFRFEKTEELEEEPEEGDIPENKPEKIENGIYTIYTALADKKVLDVRGGALEDGAYLQIYDSNGTDAQKFQVSYNEQGYYTITNRASGKVLDIKGGNTAKGTEVWQYRANGSIAQQWEIVPVKGEYYMLVAKSCGRNMEVVGGSSASGTGIQINDMSSADAQLFRFERAIDGSEADISSCYFEKNNHNQLTLHMEYILDKDVPSDDEYCYIVEVQTFDNVIEEKDVLECTEKQKNSYVEISIQSIKDAKRLAMNKVGIAVRKDGIYQLISIPQNISNPEAIASNTTKVYQGASKKGLQGITSTSLAENAGGSITDARNANTKHTLMNLDLATIVSSVPRDGYVAYAYKGNTYYFNELVDLRESIKSLNAGYKQYLYGSDGTTKVAVSLCLLLSYNSETNYLIDPAARMSGHSYYMLNVREQKARETFEAMFLYLGEIFGQGDQDTDNSCYVSNWILGNEINSSRAWNYSGSMDFDTYIDCYATAFRLLYTGVKSTKTGNTVSISLDNGWTAAPDTYAGKIVLDTFAKKINAQNPNIQWSIAYHPYSHPLTRVDFWNDYSNTTDNLYTPYISMRNISVLTNYAESLETLYGLPAGSIRILLTEQGYSYSGGDVAQATAIARGYYIAEFNDRIDAFIIRAVVDDPDEAMGQLYFGLMNRLHEKRISFYVYEHMDSDIDEFANLSPEGYISEANYNKFNKAKEILCNTEWSNYVQGFSKSKLSMIK